MPVKISTLSQLEILREGDILRKFPSHGASEPDFDETRQEDIDTYEINFYNRKEQLFRLTLNDKSGIFTWPGDMERLNIKLLDLVIENKWWVY
ncbi:hypothetical protein [Taibaiella koreensis]|uniref:hypothetical protein n=1 Tax=Taibaiella koreensis TaxID=1268548 RepID=UPI0013C2EEAD|nr:hypothetical protein [Taibaiella koreensis]